MASTRTKIKIDWAKIDNPQPVFQRYPSRRSQVYSAKGLVSSSQPLANQAGLEILNKGGNAADAAVAISAALNVTEPSCCGAGGDAFCLFWDAKTKKIRALNGSGRSPKKLTIKHCRDLGLDGPKIPINNLNAVTVPGAVACWVDTIEKFGSGKVTRQDVFAPAIRLAEQGVPVSEIHAHSWSLAVNLIKNGSPNSDEMLVNGKAPLPGQVFTSPTLAATFKEISEHGKDGYYKGRIAQAIVDLVKSKGGVMELEDLSKHVTEEVEPVSHTFADEITVYECPPNGQGITALIILGILESLQRQGLVKPILEMEHNSPEYCHTLVEATRLAFVDSEYFVADPDFYKTPMKELLDSAYLDERARLIDPTKTNPEVVHGNPIHSSDTVYFSVVDQWGNACSYIQSNYAGFGTGAIPKGCGFTLQNRGSNFYLDESLPNSLEGGKRPYHTIIPALATRNGDIWLSYGVMGGFMQPQGHVQVLLNLLRGFTAQAAVDAPRFCVSSGLPDSEVSDPPGQVGDPNSAVYFEEGIPESTVQKLREMGHDAKSVSGFARGLFGRAQVIQKFTDPSGQTIWGAGSDPRADGQAVPQI